MYVHTHTHNFQTVDIGTQARELGLFQTASGASERRGLLSLPLLRKVQELKMSAPKSPTSPGASL